jgi:uncharacterized protein (TIGR00251 family)
VKISGKGFVRRAPDGGCVLAIDVTPGASETEIMKVDPWRGLLQVRVAAEARDGAANKELIRHIASELKVSKTDVRILRGERSHLKTVYVPIDQERVKKLLGRS